MSEPATALVVALALALAMGVVLGLLGGGGSILTVPILVYVLGMPAREAIATSLLVVGVTSVAGVVQHARAGRVRWGSGALFGAFAMVGAFVGARLAAFLPTTILLLAFAALMVVAGVALLRERPSDAERDAARSAPPRLVSMAAYGALVGLVTGTVGAGGGFIVVPALVFLAGMELREAIGTSLLVVTLNSLAGFAGHVGHVELEPRLAAGFALAAVIGALAGGALSSRCPSDGLRRGFALLVLATAGYMVVRELAALVSGGG